MFLCIYISRYVEDIPHTANESLILFLFFFVRGTSGNIAVFDSILSFFFEVFLKYLEGFMIMIMGCCFILTWQRQTPRRFCHSQKPRSFCQRLSSLFHFIYRTSIGLCAGFMEVYNAILLFQRSVHLALSMALASRKTCIIWTRHVSTNAAKALHCIIHKYTFYQCLGSLYDYTSVMLLLLGNRFFFFHHCLSNFLAANLRA